MPHQNVKRSKRKGSLSRLGQAVGYAISFLLLAIVLSDALQGNLHEDEFYAITIIMIFGMFPIGTLFIFRKIKYSSFMLYLKVMALFFAGGILCQIL